MSDQASLAATPPSPLPPPTAETVFPPMYYDSPVNQMVLGFNVEAADSFTAAVTAGAPYFKVSAIDVCDWIPDRPLPPESGERPTTIGSHPVPPHAPPPGPPHLSAPVATSNGVEPLAVEPGQYARLWITADVPKGAALVPGEFTGTVALTGQSSTRTVTLEGTYLGTLIGKVTVNRRRSFRDNPFRSRSSTRSASRYPTPLSPSWCREFPAFRAGSSMQPPAPGLFLWPRPMACAPRPRRHQSWSAGRR